MTVLADKTVNEVKTPSTREELRATAQGLARIRSFPRVIEATDLKISYHCRDKIIKYQNDGFSVVEVVVRLCQHVYLI